MPASVSVLRRWTSEEALGDITVAPDSSRVPAAVAAWCVPAREGAAASADDVDADADADVAHRLPSPEEQAAVVAARFPGELVRVDVSGRTFRRMSLLRRSVLDAGTGAGRNHSARAGGSGTASSRRRTRSRRRNTLAGTDRREIRRALAGETQEYTDEIERPPSLAAADDSLVGGSHSECQKSKDSSSSSESKKSHFASLKEWGKGKLKLIKGSASNGTGSRLIIEPSEEVNVYETLTVKGKMADLKNEKKANTTGSSLPISTQSAAMNMAVKLRQRQTRAGKDDALHSSSGNWSASSESGRASIGSETTHPPKSTTTLSSAATSSNSLNHHLPSSSVSSRKKFLNTSTSSSVSEGTLTPDIVSDFAVPFADDGETSSIYSCDTEGYYTSFHLDSGLKTLKEEEPLSTPQTPLHSTSALSNSPGRGGTLTAENEYELFGKGSTSTTTSSAGTVCTTLLVSNNESSLSLARGPTVPERKSSLDHKLDEKESSSQMVIAMVHKQRGCETSESPDSGHNTSSSPVDSTSSPHGRSSEYEFSESDLEGVDRLERIRLKTTINSSRIPSMCVITPPPSDDETCLSQYVPSNRYKGSVPSSLNRKSLLETDFGPEIVSTQEKNISELSSKNDEKPKDCSVYQNNKNHSSSERTENKESLQSFISSSARPLKVTPNYIYAEPNKIVVQSTSQNDRTSCSKTSTAPFNNVRGKMKEVLSTSGSRKFYETGSLPLTKTEKASVDAGEYVTISKTSEPPSLIISPLNTRPITSDISPSSEMEYVSLNDLPVTKSPSTANVLISPSNSLERKRRQGARVTLDSEGKVIYSSDSLRRNKASYSTFEPGPYVKETVATPTASPLMVHRVVKSNIRPVTLTNPEINPPSKPISPICDSRHSKTTSHVSPILGKVIIRAGSKSNSQTNSPASPIRRVMPDHPVSPQPSRGTYIKLKSPDEFRQQSHCPEDSALTGNSPQDEEGKCVSKTQASQNMDPLPIIPQMKNGRYSRIQDVLSKHWSFTTSHFLGLASQKKSTLLNNQSHDMNPTLYEHPFNGRNMKGHQSDFKIVSKHDPFLTSHKAFMHLDSAKQEHSQLGEEYPQKVVRLPTPASIPLIPQIPSPRSLGKETYHEPVLSSTPTKSDKIHSLMEMSTVLSPISKSEILYNYKRNNMSLGVLTNTNSENQKTDSNSGNIRNIPELIHPKSSMTAEELFAAIHKSKKRMNIKEDFSINSRTGSPSSCSVRSISPGSSESSINGLKGFNLSENIISGIENVGQNRHSWSPNAKQSLDFQSYNQHVPFHKSTCKQSRVSDRLGPTQQTSRNDFKRLLLQHGSKTHGTGTFRGKLSAVEQLRLSRQQRSSTPLSNSPMNSGYLPLSPSDKRYNGPKLLPSPRSTPGWRFASPRTDILSSTILEDCAEEEKASSSSGETCAQPLDLTMNIESSQERLLSSRMATLKSDSRLTKIGSQTFPRKQETSNSLSSLLFVKDKIHQNQNSPTELYERKPVLQNSNYTSLNISKRQLLSAPLSPPNIKENVDTNQHYKSRLNSLLVTDSATLPKSQLANLRARQLFMNTDPLLKKSDTASFSASSKSLISSEKQDSVSFSTRGSPARLILAEIERRSPARTTLETAL